MKFGEYSLALSRNVVGGLKDDLIMQRLKKIGCHRVDE